LIDLHFLGIDNVLLLQGDAIKNDGRFVPDPDGHKFASELLQQVVALNHGKYMDEEIQSTNPANFCIGVAGYPEKHFAAPNLKTDLKYLKLKVDLGAEYIVTQMFFDNQKYFDFVNACREIGINVPIIPGIKPITTKGQASILPTTFHIDIPEDLADEVEKCADNKAVKEVGIQWAIQQSKELVKFGVPTLHFYSMGKSDPIYRIAKELF
jgi:methylenetetrahydrofolate reductase (NADPH)